MTKNSDSIRACADEMAPAVERLKQVAEHVCSNARELRREARQTSFDSAVRKATPPKAFPGVPGPTVHKTRGVRVEKPFDDLPTVKHKIRR
jgi:hypothetical protein